MRTKLSVYVHIVGGESCRFSWRMMSITDYLQDAPSIQSFTTTVV